MLQRNLVALIAIGLAFTAWPAHPSEPSPEALAFGYPAGPYEEANFSVSDDPVVEVLSVFAVRQNEDDGSKMRLYGDGRLEIAAAGTKYERRLERARMLEILRRAVNAGLAEWDVDVVMEQIGSAPGPPGRDTVSVQMRLSTYQRGSFERAPLITEAKLYAPESFPQIVQSRALVDLHSLLESELRLAKEEGSIRRADKAPEVPFEDARIRLSPDPEQLLLSWRTTGGMLGNVRSMELYGDGRLELRSKSESYTRELTFGEMVSVVRIAVDHGLAEWDEAKVWAAVSAAGGVLARRVSDASHESVEIHLKSYERGSYLRAPLSRAFEMRNSLGAFAEAPNVPELQGLAALAGFVKEEFRKAREGS